MIEKPKYKTIKIDYEIMLEAYKNNGKHLELMINRAQALETKLEKIQALVNEQAEDEGLWFVARIDENGNDQPIYASESYLQQELRRLHKVIEDE